LKHPFGTVSSSRCGITGRRSLPSCQVLLISDAKFGFNSVRSEQVVRTGSLGEHAVELYKAQGERPRFFLWINTGQWESIIINDEDPDLIDRYVRTQYGPITWQLSEQELREMNDRVAGKSA
jgi:hypothetical protein